ncbi:MAG: hypothetical protein ACJATI_002691 [Halioglobus sp.]|jgi:hypothetical protein
MRILLSICLSCLFLQNVLSQCDQVIDQPIIINEIGSYVEDDEDFHVNAEYIELLVIGKKENPFAKVDLAGYKVDDNNNVSIGTGNEPAHIIFSSSFPKVDPGVLILIYNPEGNIVNPALDDLPNANGVFQIPFSHDYLIKCEGYPHNQYNRQYNGCLDPDRGENWDEFIPFRNAGDVAQIREPNGNLVHAISWWKEFPIPFPESSIEFQNRRLNNKSIQFIGSNNNSKNHFQISEESSPGLPNSEANTSLIEKLKLGINESEVGLSADVIQNPSESESNGVIGVDINGLKNGAIYTVTLNGDEYTSSNGVTTFATPNLKIYNIAAEEYTIEIIYGENDCTVSTTIVVTEDKIINTEICEGDCITLNSSTVDPDLLSQTPCIKWINEEGEIISSEEEVEICTEGSQTITQYIENSDGIIEEIIYHNVSVVDMSFDILEKIPDECPPSSIEVEIVGENISEILWSDGTTDELKVITSGGEYAVTLTSPEGCVSETSITISEDIFTDQDGDGICDNEDCNPYQPSGGQGTPCNDYNASTINDVYNENCDCIGEIDPDNPCDGEDQDGDGICDDEEENNGTSPFDPCDPNDTDSDLDGVCDNADCFPNISSISYSIGNSCDDNNASTIGDIVNQNCECVGIPDPSSPCPGEDQDGDGICDDIDHFPEDDCNELSVEIEGDISLCLDQYSTDLNASISGGIEPYTIKWEEDQSSNEITLNSPIPESYAITVTDNNGCTATNSVTITQYQQNDSDGDGYCDDESCPITEIGEYGDFPILLGNIEIVDPVGLKDEKNNESRQSDCDISCVETIAGYNFNVCLVELTSIKFSKSFCTENDIEEVDPIEFLISSFSAYLADCSNVTPSEIFLLITDEEDYDKCCELKAEIETQYWENDNKPVGIWLDIKVENGVSKGELKTKYEGLTISNDCDEWGGPFENNEIAGDPFGDFTKINNSLFNNYASSVIPNPANLVNNTPNTANEGLIDFAGLSQDVRENIAENVAIGKDVWSDAGFNYEAKFIVSSANCLVNYNDEWQESSKAAQSAFEADGSNSLVVWIHFDENNNALFDAKINGNIPQDLKDQIKENLKFAAKQSLSSIKTKAEKPANLDPELDGVNLWRFGIREEVDNQLNFWGITKEIGGLCMNTIEKVATPEQAWKEKGNEEGKTSMFKIPPSIAGGSDAALENNPIGGLIQLVDLGEAVITKPEVRSAMLKAVKDPLTVGKNMMDQFSADISGENGKEIQHHTVVKASVNAVLVILIGGGKILDFLENAGKKSADKFEGFSEFLKDFDTPDIEQFYEKIKSILNSETLQKQFRESLLDLGTPNCKAFIDNPYLVDVWKKYLDDFPSKIDDLWTPFKNGKLPFDNPEFFGEFKKVFVKTDGSINTNVDKFFEDLKIADIDFVNLLKVKPKLIKAWDDMLDMSFYNGLKKGHDIRLNSKFLKKYNSLSPDKKLKMKEYMKNQKSPAGRKGQVDYYETRNVEGIGDVTIYYDKNGFPEFENYCAKPTDKFKYISDNLKGTAADFKKANEQLAEKFGFSKPYPKDADGKFLPLSSGTYEWTPGKNNFTKDGVKHTWHHHQDGKNIFPVQSRVHSTTEVGSLGFPHSGGDKLINEDLKEFFDPPLF